MSQPVSHLKPEKKQELSTIFAGGVSGAITALLFCPLDVCKTRLQVQKVPSGQKPKYKGFIRTLRIMAAEEGITSWYKGLGVTQLGLIPNWAIYFYTYDSSKRRLSQLFQKSENSLPVSGLAGVWSGAFTQFLTSPFWVVRTRMQTQIIVPGTTPVYRNLVQSLMRIFQEEGIRSLWKGFVPSLFGLVHVGVQLPTYERLKLKLQERHPQQQLSPSELLAASASAKLVASVSAYPHEVIRSRFQDTPNRYKSIPDSIKTIYREEGFLAFYKGMGTNLFRVVPAAAITFSAYELTLRQLEKGSW